MLQGKGGSEHEGGLNEEDAEDTIICSTSSTSVNKKVLIKKVTQLESDNEEEEIIGSAEEMDDDKDEDFEVNNEDSDEEDVGVEGDDVSEVEGMLKERRFHGSRKKPRGDIRKQSRRPIGPNFNRNYLPVHSAFLNVSKHGRKVSPKMKLWKRHLTNSVQGSLAKDSQPRDIPHRLARDTDTDFSEGALQSGYPVEHGERIPLPTNPISTKRTPHDMAQLVPVETLVGPEKRPSHTLSPINLPIKHEGELANNLLLPDSSLHPQVIYSEEDEVWNTVEPMSR